MSISQSAATLSIPREELDRLAREFEHTPPATVLRWATAVFGTQVAFATGFGAEGCVLVHLLAQVSPETQIFYLDTGFLFPETYELADRLANRYGVAFTRVTRKQQFPTLENLWEQDPDACCRMRKVEPLTAHLRQLDAWMTAIRRDQSPTRAETKVIEWDRKFGLIKINPLAFWTEREVWNFILKHDVPYNPLHNQGYPSIGCTPCTSPVQIGEHSRAGRWRGREKTECGLHQ
ncbi:MAG: phosphoadenylyl-sulfate reductase [Blastocatellia bacterium]|nr:phosphoadenylyl-sulfate reductase [Blastocatellia bacterium]